MSESVEELKELSNYQKNKKYIMKWRKKNREKYLIMNSNNSSKYYENNRQLVINKNLLYYHGKKVPIENKKVLGRPRKYPRLPSNEII